MSTSRSAHHAARTATSRPHRRRPRSGRATSRRSGAKLRGRERSSAVHERARCSSAAARRACSSPPRSRCSARRCAARSSFGRVRSPSRRTRPRWIARAFWPGSRWASRASPWARRASTREACAHSGGPTSRRTAPLRSLSRGMPGWTQISTSSSGGPDRTSQPGSGTSRRPARAAARSGGVDPELARWGVAGPRTLAPSRRRGTTR